ncbi:MAG: preprotein translocase subunit YajC [Acidobacteria bacterium]|nr:preprotein translocase subunit YajC [Acidobacteriota bacterium]
MYFANFLFQAASGGVALIQFLPYIAILLVFYFLLFLPNQKRQKKLAELLANLKNGDRVVTVGGVHGTIVGLRDEYVVLRVPPDAVKLEVQRGAITALENPEQETP